MRLRLLEQPWGHPSQRYLIEVWNGEFFQCAGYFASEDEAREFAALYAKGPRLIEEFNDSSIASTAGSLSEPTPALASLAS